MSDLKSTKLLLLISPSDSDSFTITKASNKKTCHYFSATFFSLFICLTTDYFKRKKEKNCLIVSASVSHYQS